MWFFLPPPDLGVMRNVDLQIFSKWGYLIHMTSVEELNPFDPTNVSRLTWDGETHWREEHYQDNIKEALLYSWCYVYEVQYTDENGKRKKLAGTITVVR